MPSYRCYFIDGRGSYWDARTIETENAQSAIVRALAELREKPRCRRLEIWDDAHIVYKREEKIDGKPDSGREFLVRSCKMLVSRCFGGTFLEDDA